MTAFDDGEMRTLPCFTYVPMTPTLFAPGSALAWMVDIVMLEGDCCVACSLPSTCRYDGYDLCTLMWSHVVMVASGFSFLRQIQAVSTSSWFVRPRIRRPRQLVAALPSWLLF